MIRVLVLAGLLVLAVALPARAQPAPDPPPAAALLVSCDGLVCTLDASASTDDGPLTYAWDCGLGPNCSPVGPSVRTVTYPHAGARTARVTVTDTSGQTSSASATFDVSDQPPTPTLTPTVTATATETSTPSPTATETPTALPTDTATPTPTETATSTLTVTGTLPALFGLCPGQFAGMTVAENTLTMTCVKLTGTPWPWETPGGIP